MLNNLSFDKQVKLGILGTAVGFLGAFFLHLPYFYNLGITFYGLLFLLHPVFPEKVNPSRQAYTIMRLIGGLVFVIGLTGRFV